MYNENLICDVGMHNGSDTSFYLGQGYKVIAIDADPVLVENANRQFEKQIHNGMLTVINAGIHTVSGEFDFHVNEVRSEWNSFDKSIASRDGLPFHTVKVPCYNFGEILNQYGVPYYLKVDIEGHDYLCIQALDSNDLPKFISVEANDISLIEQLAAKGFAKYKLIWQYNFAPLEIPVNKYFKYWMWGQKLRKWNSLPIIIFRKFGGVKLIQFIDRLSVPQENRKLAKGSSGNFGPDLQGKWLSQKEAEYTYMYYERKYSQLSRNREYGFWADIHATW